MMRANHFSDLNHQPDMLDKRNRELHVKYMVVQAAVLKIFHGA